MMAQEIFEKLGYVLSSNLDGTVYQYEKKCRQWREEGQININFDLEDKTIDTIFRGEVSGDLPPIFDATEIYAMNKQCEELGWYDGMEI